METRELPMRTVEMVAATRFALGVGIGLLLARRLPARYRDTIGWGLVGGGLCSTAPLLMQVWGAKVHTRRVLPSRHVPEKLEA